MGGASQQKPDAAAQEVAPLDVRSCGRSSRIGSFCDVAAAPAWVQACGWAVGRVRNASPFREVPVFKIAGFVFAFCENFAKASRTSKRILRLWHLASMLRSTQ